MGKNGTLVALLLVLVCAGQAVLAVSAPCALVGGTAVESTGDSVHAGHHMAGDSIPADQAGDCCDGGYCSLAGCLGAAALAEATGTAAMALQRSAPDSVAPATPLSPTEALFRPPIYG